MRKIALDIGTVRIGIATSDPMGIIASGYETFERTKNNEADMKYIADLATTKQCDTIVIGLPLNMDGTEGEKVKEIRAFADELTQYTSLKIAFQDERWSTVSAEKMLIQNSVRREKRKSIIDKVAATIILQTYLDRIH